MAALSLCALRAPAPAGSRRSAPRRTVTVRAAAWTKLTSKSELASNDGRVVVSTESAGKVLVQESDGEVYAVSNKCPHLGLPLQGRTALLSAEVKDACLVCPAHKTAFSLADGSVQGEWCPGLPELPIVGKPLLGEPAPLPTYEVRVNDDGSIEAML